MKCDITQQNENPPTLSTLQMKKKMQQQNII
jgi:hypothetical protein